MNQNKWLNFNTHFREILVYSGSTLFFKLVGLVLSYVVILFITNNFGAEIYGRYALMITLCQILALLFTFGLPTLIVKFTSNREHFNKFSQTDFLSVSVRFTLVIGLIISFTIYLFSEKLAVHIFHDAKYMDYLKLLSFVATPLMFHEVFLGFFKGKKDFTKHNVFLFILPPVFFFLFFFLLRNYYSSGSIVFLCYCASITTIFVIEFKFIFSYIIKKTKQLFSYRDLIKESLPMMYSAILLYLLGWTDILMIEGLLTSKDVGIYSAALKIASIGFIVITSINVVIAPKIVELFYNKEIIVLHKTIVQSTRLIIFLTIPIIFFIVVFRKVLLNFFGNEFVHGETALVLIASGVLYSAICGNVDQLLNMTNNQKILRNIILFCFVLNIVLNFFLIKYFEINGAAMASLITNIVLNSLCVYYVKKELGFYTFIYNS